MRERAWPPIIARHLARDLVQSLVSKLSIVEQELDETLLWLELLVESGIVPGAKMAGLQQEADELLRMTITAIKTAKGKM